MAKQTPKFITLDEAAKLGGAIFRVTRHDIGITFVAREWAENIAALDRDVPGWRELKHPNGAPMFSERTGVMLDDQGYRSIFDDVDK